MLSTWLAVGGDDFAGCWTGVGLCGATRSDYSCLVSPCGWPQLLLAVLISYSVLFLAFHPQPTHTSRSQPSNGHRSVSLLQPPNARIYLGMYGLSPSLRTARSLRPTCINVQPQHRAIPCPSSDPPTWPPCPPARPSSPQTPSAHARRIGAAQTGALRSAGSADTHGAHGAANGAEGGVRAAGSAGALHIPVDSAEGGTPLTPPSAQQIRPIVSRPRHRPLRLLARPRPPSRAHLR